MAAKFKFTANVEVTSYVSRTSTSRSNSIYPQAGQSQYTTYYLDTAGRTSSTSSTYENSSLRWDRDRLAARGNSATADRWEYRYNAKGEVGQGWKQFGSGVGSSGASSTTGEVKASTGSVYRYDEIGNRTGSDEIGRASVSGTPTILTPTTTGAGDVRTTSYGTAGMATTANAVNQYTRITRPTPGFFNVRGTRSTGATIVVNGDAVDNPNTADSGYQQTNTGTFFRDEVPNTAPSGTTTPDIYEPVAATQNGSTLTLDDPVQYVPPPVENLTYDLDGNLLTDGRWTYTWDLADRLVKMVSLPFTQPAAGAVPLRNVKGLTVEFTYDGFSRRIGKKVSELAPGLPGGTAPTLVKWEAYVYDGWNMIATYQRHLTGTYAGKAQKRFATHVWGPDIGSRLEARRDWQAAGGVGGLLMTLYPTPPAGSVPSYENWLAGQGVYLATQIGYEDGNGNWVPWYGEYTEPFYDENSGYWVEEYGGYQTPYGFMTYSMASGYSWDYGYYEQAMLGHHLVHVPVMDHMGNVTSVVRLSATPGSGSGSISQREFLYDYDAFGKEQRASALIAGSNPDSYPFHYSTKFTDAETGLVYYGYRFYDPERGRWINRDPIGERGGINLFGTLGNDAINSLDRLGLDSRIGLLQPGAAATLAEIAEVGAVSYPASSTALTLTGSALGDAAVGAGAITASALVANAIEMAQALEKCQQLARDYHAAQKRSDAYAEDIKKLLNKVNVPKKDRNCHDMSELCKMLNSRIKNMQEEVDGRTNWKKAGCDTIQNKPLDDGHWHPETGQTAIKERALEKLKALKNTLGCDDKKGT